MIVIFDCQRGAGERLRLGHILDAIDHHFVKHMITLYLLALIELLTIWQSSGSIEIPQLSTVHLPFSHAPSDSDLGQCPAFATDNPMRDPIRASGHICLV